MPVRIEGCGSRDCQTGLVASGCAPGPAWCRALKRTVMADKIRVLKTLGDMPLWDAAGARAAAAEEAQVGSIGPVAGAGERRIGLFVDTENVNLGCLREVIEGLLGEGQLRVRRAFGHWSGGLSGPDAEVQLVHGIELRQYPRLTNFGKNAADIAMAVDVMDELSRDEVDTFALVSSDSDFTPLVHRLRRAGKVVWGYGLGSAPDSLRLACDRFEEIGEEAGGAPPRRSPGPARAARTATKESPEQILMRIVREMPEKHSGGWKEVSRIGTRLQAEGVAVKSLGKAKLSAVFKGRAEFEVGDFGGPGGRCVRVKTAGGAQQPAVFGEEEIGILRAAMTREADDAGWVRIDVLSKALRSEGRWDFERHKGKLGKRLRRLEWVEAHAEDPLRVRIRP